MRNNNNNGSDLWEVEFPKAISPLWRFFVDANKRPIQLMIKTREGDSLLVSYSKLPEG